MKYATLLLIIFLACKPADPNQIFINQINDQVPKEMNDPSSYEFVGIERIDTITIAEDLSADIRREERVLAAYESGVISSEALLDAYREGIRWGTSTKADLEKQKLEVEAAKNNVEKSKLQIKDMYSAMEAPGSKATKRYDVYFKVRGKNSYGALILADYKAEFSDSLKYIGHYQLEK